MALVKAKNNFENIKLIRNRNFYKKKRIITVND